MVNEEEKMMTDQQKEQGAIKEIAQAYEAIQYQNDFIKDVCARMKEEIESDPAELKKLGRMLHKQNMEEEKEKANAIFDKYEE
ncbi:MAG: hypothetical protein LC687_06690, partial [Actinobacteria bacterium]|nr:hypothetical protein [Actinomycetota bacterium]